MGHVNAKSSAPAYNAQLAVDEKTQFIRLICAIRPMTLNSLKRCINKPNRSWASNPIGGIRLIRVTIVWSNWRMCKRPQWMR